METCRLCGKQNMKRLGFHLRKMHGMSMKDYNTYSTQPSTGQVLMHVTPKGDGKARALIARIKTVVKTWFK